MSSSRVKSAERVMAVLDLLASRVTPLTALEIAAELDLPKSTTHHLLNVMQERRYVAHWPDRRVWSLGTSALEIGAAYLRTGHLQHAGQRHLAALTARTGQTSHLAVLQGTDVLYLDKREPQGSGIRLVTEVGTRLPAHLTAVGRSILAGLGDGELRALFTEYEWPRRTDVQIASLAELTGVLTAVREAGYADEVGSTTSGIECVAAPVVGSDGRPVAAIGIAMVSGTRPRPVADLAVEVQAVAQQFSQALAGT
ncbi:IclR family transcriptional regulator [Kineococcus rhizosphaerae]|uniref:IclR family transcriptional regulator n=1 Tax=Kineococcus rhizosphaerae TaxID=559628 RepID=A0A2T0QYT8_9ACTN|nr:IclR family transcriptional regulator [Kineococcus rhizosphaerae]PRY11528.1 IclR family transcriptional regulator [Kineococcus rhizosphaerae]